MWSGKSIAITHDTSNGGQLLKNGGHTVKSLVMIFMIAACFGISPSAVFCQEQVAAKELLRAPTIVVGKVEALSYEGKDTLERGAPIEVEVFHVSIIVQKVLKGEDAGKAVVLKHLLRPSNPNTYIGRQFLEVDKIYIFFLSPTIAQDEFEPINPSEFALEIDSLPKEYKKGESAVQQLRGIAKANIDSARESLAERWFGFLGELYDAKEDFRFCMDRTSDPRLRIRGSALAVLCEHSPAAPLLYSKSMKFVKETSEMEELWSWRRRISKCLPGTLGEKDLTTEKLKEWIESDVRELQEVALGIVMEKRDASLVDEIVGLMVRTRNRDIQYDCVKALSAVSDRRGPSYREFMKTPGKYVDEWKKLKTVDEGGSEPEDKQ